MSERHGHPDCDLASRDEDLHDPDPASGRRPMYLRADPYDFQHMFCESAGSPWAIGPTLVHLHEQAVVRGQLEEVGRILERLELQRTEISVLRAETREILARLAA